MDTIKKLVEAVKKSKNIAILSHVGPDGDTLGSMLALAAMIEQENTNKNVQRLIVGKVPDVYKFLPDVESVVTVDNPQILGSYDLVITSDCAAIDRLGESIEIFRNAKLTANVDHHVSNNNFADINIVDPKASATGEVVFHIAKALGLKIKKEVAINLYTAILTDTGGFKFENTRPETFEVAAALMRAGVNPGYVFKKCYESKPIAMVKLQAHCVDNAIFEKKGKIAYTLISRKMLQDFSATDDHTDGVSEALRQISTVEVSMVFKETVKGNSKVSFRSNKADVCEIARFFGGGGHKLAAGCTIEKNIEDAAKEVLPIVEKQISKSN